MLDPFSLPQSVTSAAEDGRVCQPSVKLKSLELNMPDMKVVERKKSEVGEQNWQVTSFF